MLDGQQIANPAGWLVLVTYRRAIDEQRARSRDGQRADPAGRAVPPQREPEATLGLAGNGDLADAIDDRELLRQLFEGLRCRLSPEEREAAVLCYLHGLTRTEARHDASADGACAG